MQTTLRIDDALYRQAKVAAAHEGVTLTKFIEEALHLRLNHAGELAGVRRAGPLESDQPRLALTDDVNHAALLERLQVLFEQADERDRSKEGSAGPFSREELYADHLDRFR